MKAFALGQLVANDQDCTAAHYLSQVSRALELFAGIATERAREITQSMDQHPGDLGRDKRPLAG